MLRLQRLKFLRHVPRVEKSKSITIFPFPFSRTAVTSWWPLAAPYPPPTLNTTTSLVAPGPPWPPGTSPQSCAVVVSTWSPTDSWFWVVWLQDLRKPMPLWSLMRRRCGLHMVRLCHLLPGSKRFLVSILIGFWNKALGINRLLKRGGMFRTTF